MKVYELEESLDLPNIDYENWENPVARELADNGLSFLSRILLSQGSIFRVADILENKEEIMTSYKTSFLNKETKEFASSVFDLFRISNTLIEFSNMEETEDLIVLSHIKKKNKHTLSLYILKRIMNVVMTEKEVIEVIAKELSSFDYNNLANIAISEEKMFNLTSLALAKQEMEHALKHKLVSHKTMEFVKFLNNIYQKSITKKEEESKYIFLMDVVNILA